MNKKKLKDSILEYAFRGGLTSHKKNESTFHNSSNNENSFPALPENWELKKIGDVFNVVSARRIKKSDWRSQGVPFYRAREIVKLSEKGYVENEIFIDENLYLQYSNSKSPIPGDLMISAVGTLGKSYVVKPGDKFYYKDASVLCLKNINNLVPEYVKYYLDSPYFVNQITSNSKGTTVGTLTIVRMNDYLIPVPPLEEQQAIVKKIDKLITKIDYYNLRYTELEKLQEQIPSLLEKSILQYAIEGKLVEQDTSDEPASELLKRVSEQKKQMIKGKIIKKEKALPPIIEEEIPFDIPDTWEWVRIKDVYYNDGQIKPDQTFYYVDVSAIDNKKGEISKDIKLTSKESAPSRARKITSYGDILYSTVRPYLKNIAIVDVKKDMPLIASTAFVVMRPIEIYNEYLYYVLKSPYFDNEVKNRVQGVTYPAINDTNFNSLLVPIPPLNEQHRIVSKIKNILLYIDDLTSF